MHQIYTVCYVCRGSSRKIKKFAYHIGDNSVIVAEMITISEAVRMPIQMGTPKVTTESYSQIANAFTGLGQTLNQLGNLVLGIKNVASCIIDIQFVYCNRMPTALQTT